jgi:hypothetical protein
MAETETKVARRGYDGGGTFAEPPAVVALGLAFKSYLSIVPAGPAQNDNRLHIGP